MHDTRKLSRRRTKPIEDLLSSRIEPIINHIPDNGNYTFPTKIARSIGQDPDTTLRWLSLIYAFQRLPRIELIHAGRVTLVRRRLGKQKERAVIE